MAQSAEEIKANEAALDKFKMSMFSLEGKVAIITGGNTGLGQGYAVALAEAGADIFIATHGQEGWDDTRKMIEKRGRRVEFMQCDLTEEGVAQEVIDNALDKFGHIDILINNAAQTVRRSAGAYSGLADGENAPLDPAVGEAVDWVSLGTTTSIHPGQLTGAAGAAISGSGTGSGAGSGSAVAEAGHSLPTDSAAADALVSAALTGGSASLDRVAEGTAVDAGGLIPDLVAHNSWVATVGQVDPVELLEVQLCNSVAPFILVNRLRPAMEASTFARKYVVNVSAMEGVFGRGYKGPGHPHTNMAKAALNMLTRTSSSELREHGILMTAVDTGWITDERPHVTKERLAKEGFHAPLDLIDGAARVYHPIVAGETGGPEYSGVFLKDYEPSSW